MTNIKEFQCSNCNKQFGTKNNLRSHIKNKHENIKHFKCDLCGVQFKQEYEFQNHYKNVHDKTTANAQRVLFTSLLPL
jgi:RNase P subunit RPR2